MTARAVRIGCHAAFWGDSTAYAEQLVRRARVDYLVSDYLAEITMSLLARARQSDPAAGFALDVVEAVGPLLPELQANGTKVVTNAGGLNARACRDALRRAATELGATPRIAVVEGDDLMPRLDAVRAMDPLEIATGRPLPARVASMNAYLGAVPIARALAAGADIVVCGRVVDSALALGPLLHEFGWPPDAYDLLAAGSLAGHVIECGAQATGGIFTDWRDVPGWDDMGMPIVECASDGTFVVTKPAGTGGAVTTATVGEQIVYEIGDPAAYVLPDVTCDFTHVRLSGAGADRVAVSGARGTAPPLAYKVCATYPDGYRLLSTALIAGGEAAARAERTGAAIIARVERLLAARKLAPFAETCIEVVGGGAIVGDPTIARGCREAVLKIGARHEQRAALELLARETPAAGCAMAQGLTGLIGGRATPSPVIRLFSFLLERQFVDERVAVDLDGVPVLLHPAQPAASADGYAPPTVRAATPQEEARSAPVPAFANGRGGGRRTVPLRTIARGRSGDKGDACNIGVIARHPAVTATIAEQMSAARVAERFAYVARGPVTRFDLPGLHAFNFVIERALGGGGVASLRYDPQGKSYAQILLDEPVEVPVAWLDAEGGLDLQRLPAASAS